jgi:hypothetical protein
MSKLFGTSTPRRPHLVRPGGGLKGEIADLRSDVNEAFGVMEQSGGLIRLDEFIDPPTADTDAFLTSFPTSASEQVFEAADLDGVVGDGELPYARNVTITSTTHAHVTAVDVVIEGYVLRDGREVPVTITITTTNGGNATDASVATLHRISRVTIPAMGGASGALEIGFGARLGLSETMRSYAGRTGPLQEVAAGAVVTNGAFANPTGSPIASYTPNAAPDGSRDYAVAYIVG